MLQWISCYVFRWHDWVYEPGPENCSTIGICRRCDEDSYEVWHEVKRWNSDGWTSRTESGVCVRCEQSQTRLDPRLGTRRR